MELPLQQMSVREFAETQAQFGVKVVGQNGQFWRRVRPFFYRPILPVAGYDGSAVHPPCRWPGGYQYVVSDGQPANSTMNFLMLDHLQEYSLYRLGHKRRHLITQAARRFHVRPIRDLRELKEQGYKAFLSFYERTGYSYKSERRNRASFDHWAETIFRHPKAILLGGFGPDGLAAVSCSYWVDQTLVYATLFCETEALRRNVGELLFHELRQLAAQQPKIAEIFLRAYQGGNRHDRYYLLRGCKLVKKPARLEMPSPAKALLKWFLPGRHALLCGED